jgi:DNA-binding NarL/FixJ family response regulator
MSRARVLVAGRARVLGAGRARVLVADDHAPTREDIRAAVDADDRFTVVAEASDAAEAVTAAVRERPDLALLDMRMPGSGAAAAWEITARLPDTRAVMLTISRSDEDLFAALRAGASGYLLKTMPFSELGDELAGVLDGQVALPPELVSRLVEEFRDSAPRRRALLGRGAGGAQLTSREWQVLDYLRQGLATAEIARRLFVSPATVRSHVAAVLRKLRVPDREAAVRLFEDSA